MWLLQRLYLFAREWDCLSPPHTRLWVQCLALVLRAD